MSVVGDYFFNILIWIFRYQRTNKHSLVSPANAVNWPVQVECKLRHHIPFNLETISSNGSRGDPNPGLCGLCTSYSDRVPDID